MFHHVTALVVKYEVNITSFQEQLANVALFLCGLFLTRIRQHRGREYLGKEMLEIRST